LDEPDSPSSTCTSHNVIAPTSTPPIAEIPFSVEPSEDVIEERDPSARERLASDGPPRRRYRPSEDTYRVMRCATIDG